MTVSARQNTETPSEHRRKLQAIRCRIVDMADAGMGWEDIVVRLRRDGENIDPHKHTIRRFVLSNARRPRTLAGAGRSGPGPICRLGGRDDPTQN